MKINIYLIESVVNINKHLINIIFVYLHINIKKYIFFKKKIHPIKFIMKKFAWPLPPPFNFILSFYLEKIKKNRFFGSDADIYIYWVIILIKRIWGNQVWWNHMQEDNWFVLKNSLLWTNIFMKRWYDSLNKFKIFPITK